MDNTQVALSNTVLKDRTLWFDGDSSYESDRLSELIRKYDVRYVDKLTQEIIDYNRHVGSAERIKVKSELAPLNFDWNVPDKYKKLNLVRFFTNAHTILMEGKSTRELEEREVRLAQEIVLYKKLGLLDVLRTLVWIITEFTANNVVWGIGRGSSTSSYLLYVIGVHDVDSFAYDLDVADFLR